MDANLLSEAARLAQGQNPASAKPLVARLLAAHPGDPDVLTLVGMVAQRCGDSEAALSAFAQARKGDPANPARIGNHALALKAAGRFEDAIAALREADLLRPGHAITLANLGGCLIDADRPGDAEAPLRAAIDAKRDHAEAWNNLGIALARTNRATGAIEAYRQALKLRPSWPEAALNLVDALIAADNRNEADLLAKQIQEHHPGHPRACNQRAAIAEQRGDFAQAIAFYEASLHHGFSYPVAHNLASALMAVGDAERVLQLSHRMIEASPAVTTPIAIACAALFRLGRIDALNALTNLDRFVEIVEIEQAPGFGSLAAFHAALAAEFRAHPSLTFEPVGLVTRKGRQSADLATATSPALRTLAQIAHSAIATRWQALNGDSEHPWLRARPRDWTLTMWGTLLAPGGAVDAHIHAPNWLSGVYYPDLPDAIAHGDEGAFAIGALPQRWGGGGVVRTISARPGRLILFPSFLWHATLPFGGKQERLSFAFDLVPAGIGRPHRL